MIFAVPLLDDLRRAIREDARTQREIAAAIGVHEVTLSNFVRRKVDLPGDKLESLIDVLGVRVTVQPARPAKPPQRAKGGAK